MAKCNFCGDELDYLPFKCKYCGKEYCKIHRLPENHNCSFELKHDPFLAKPPKVQVIKSHEQIEEMPYDKIYSSPRDARDRVTPWGANIIRPRIAQMSLKATYLFMIFQLIGFILSLIDATAPHMYLAANQLLKFYFHTIFTPMFNPGDPLSLIFDLLIIYFVGRLIEGRFGTRTFVEIYILSALIAAASIIILQSLLSLIPYFGINFLNFGYSTLSGAIMGLIAFMTLILPDMEMNVFIFLIPVRFKTRYLLWFFIGFYLLFGVIDLILFFTADNLFPSFVGDFGNLFGAIGGWMILNKYKKSTTQEFSRFY
ncbi:MAG: rhomboid family intramembrane serine protease [Promethearchaeota archaeon]